MMWYDRPITFDDVVHSVDQFLNPYITDRADRDEFIVYECQRWLGEIWRDADTWDMSRDWQNYSRERLTY